MMGTIACAKGPSEAAPAEAPVSAASASAGPSGPAAPGAPSGPADPTGPVAPSTPSNPAASSTDPAFECQIRVDPRIKLGQPATVHFRLSLRSPQAVYVLNWRTPLEGLRGDDFLVTRDGVEVPYRGPMMKRGNPGAESYLALTPSKPLEADVNLGLAYDFTKAGHYKITFRGKVWDVVTKPSDIPRPLDRHQPAQLQCAPVETDVVP
ncbi:protease [Pendulispora albinea]|uniref:Protease n=1 Tax=Pendulispora albinea TaxID=2741071 RepID=A0ABZ2M8B4_9BACT